MSSADGIEVELVSNEDLLCCLGCEFIAQDQLLMSGGEQTNDTQVKFSLFCLR